MAGGGFGSGPFGSYYFGEWPWSISTILEGVPEVYRNQDELAGSGSLRTLLEGLTPSLDDIRHKIRDYDDLRDPLLAPTDRDFDENVIVIRSDNQGDGTSIVFISQGPNADKYTGIRPGMVLVDLTKNRFSIESVHSSYLPTDFEDPPIDPATTLPTGRHVVVRNIGQSSTELIPYTSSTLISNEIPSPVGAVGSISAVAKASLIDGETFTLQDGSNPPVVFEFDVTPNGITPGRVSVNVGSAISAVDVATVMVESINNAINLNLLATNGSGTLATVSIINTGIGTAGNFPSISWFETVASAGFVIIQPNSGAAGAFPLDPSGFNDGVKLSPYVFNSSGAVISGPAIAPNRIAITWTESGVKKTGFFTADGNPGGDLSDSSLLNRSTSALALTSGQFQLYNSSGAAIDASSIQVTYSITPLVQTEDAEIRSQNILSFLAGDYGVKLDRNDPVSFQRSYVSNAFKIWDVKGADLGYDVIGKYAGYFVSASPLYSISQNVAAGLPSNLVFELPEGDPAIGYITAISPSGLIEGETFSLDDGFNLPVVFEFDTDSIVSGSNIIVNISSSVTALDVANAIVASINSVVALNLNASNSGILTSITVTNSENGSSGNVVSWSSGVANPGFLITQPVGGIDSNLFTTANPGRGSFDEIALDTLPLDLLCSDVSYPQVLQSVNAISAVKIGNEGSNKRSIVTVTTLTPYFSFSTDGTFTDFNGSVFDVLNFTRLSSSTYTFEVVSFLLPVVGAGSIKWNVFKFESNQANGLLTFGGNALNNETVTIGVKTYTFQSVLTNIDGNVLIGASASASINNLYSAIVLGAGAGVSYAAATVAHPTAGASVPVAATMVVFALVGGVAGNAIATTETLLAGSFSASTLAGGAVHNAVSILGIGVDVVDLGGQFGGYTGRRYKITKQFINPALSNAGNWAFIDSAGVISFIENFYETPVAGIYSFEIISSSVPAIGQANIFYRCEIVTSCDFCRSSSLLIKISPSSILNFPESLEGDALSRLIIRLEQMIPAHVRSASFLYDPGPAIAAWGGLVASTVIAERSEDDGLYTAVYDEDEFPADLIPTDSAPITASSELTVVNQNALEEFLVGADPLISGAWVATGQWKTAKYRSSTSEKSFLYGSGDVGSFGSPGSTPPTYDSGGISTGTLISPVVNIPSATTVNLKFRHFGQVRPGANDTLSVLVVDETVPAVVQTVTKTDLGLIGSGTNGGFTSFSVNIGPAVIGNGNFHLEFIFNSVTTTLGQTGEGWYVDDIEIQVIP
jgi:hypothetical protein